MKRNIDPILAWSLIMAAISIMLILIFVQLRQLTPAVKQISQTPKESIVVIDYGNGKVRRFKGPVAETTRAWDLFQQAIAIGGINIEVADHFVPTDIGGVKDGSGGRHWSLYVNNVRQKFSPFEVQVKPGEEVAFRFE